MRNSESRSSYYRSRSSSRDDDRAERDSRDRRKDRDDRDYYSSRRRRSKSRSYSHKSKKSKHSKKSKKYRSRRSSSRSSSSEPSSYSSDESSRGSSYRHRSDNKQRRSRTRGRSSSESNSRLSASTREKSKSKSSALSSGKSSSTKHLSVAVREIDIQDSHVKKALQTIEEDSFVQEEFYSTRDREAPSASEKVVIDLNAETITLPKSNADTNAEASCRREEIFHPNFLGDADIKTEKWIRKLFNFRQKYYEPIHH